MAYIGRQQSSGSFLKLDDISSSFDGSAVRFNLTLGGTAFFPGNPYSLMISLGGVIQEPIASFTIIDDQIEFAAAPASNANFFCVVLATTNTDPLKTLSVLSRSGVKKLDLHRRSMTITDRSGTKIPIAFNLA